MSNFLEEVWDDILSRHPNRIKHRFNLLDSDSQQEVALHLKRMATEPGWQEVQVISARAALEALGLSDTC